MNATTPPGISSRHPDAAGRRAVVPHRRPRLRALAVQVLLLLTGGGAMAAKPAVSIDAGERLLQPGIVVIPGILSVGRRRQQQVDRLAPLGARPAGFEPRLRLGIGCLREWFC